MNDWTVKLLCLSRDFKNSKVVPSAVHFAFQIIFFRTINFVLFILIIEIINLWFCHVSFHTYYLIYGCSCVCVKLIYCMYIWCIMSLYLCNHAYKKLNHESCTCIYEQSNQIHFVYYLGTFGAAVTIISHGQEEKDLNKVEKRCNTCIKDLPGICISIVVLSYWIKFTQHWITNYS